MPIPRDFNKRYGVGCRGDRRSTPAQSRGFEPAPTHIIASHVPQLKPVGDDNEEFVKMMYEAASKSKE